MAIVFFRVLVAYCSMKNQEKKYCRIEIVQWSFEMEGKMQWPGPHRTKEICFLLVRAFILR